MNRFSAIVVIILATLLALTVTVELSTSETSINRLATYLAIAAFVLPLLNPLRGYAILIFLGGYLEVLKFGAWWQNARFVDMVTLNIPPIAAIAGICAGCLLGMITGRIQVTRTLVMIWAGAVVAGCVVGLKTLSGGGQPGQSSLGDAANAAAYLMMVPATASLLRSREDWRKLLSMTLWIMLPSAVYGIYQGLVGYPDFHFQFLASYRGWIFDPRVYIQPVGTMNGAIAFGTTMGICFCMVIIRANLREKVRMADWTMGFTFLLATVLSGRRSALLLIIAFAIGILFFKSPRRAFVLYASSLLVILSLYAFANPMIYFFDSVNRQAEQKFGADSFVSRVANVGTFNDRLLGFRNMATNPKLWSFFGADVGDDYGKFGYGLGEDASIQKRAGNYDLLRNDFVHDGFNKAIISYGAVPIFILLVIGLAGIIKVHRIQFSIRDQIWKSQLRYGVAFTFAVSTIVLTSQQALTVQPINLMVFMVFGAFVFLIREAESVRLGPVRGATQAPDPGVARIGRPVRLEG